MVPVQCLALAPSRRNVDCVTPDLNATIANLIDDLAEIQESKQSQMGYRRAAHAILLLEQTVTALILPGEDLPSIPNVGPKSRQVAVRNRPRTAWRRDRNASGSRPRRRGVLQPHAGGRLRRQLPVGVKGSRGCSVGTLMTTRGLLR